MANNINNYYIICYGICKKVKKDKGSTFLSLREQEEAEKAYGRFEEKEGTQAKLSGKQKLTLIFFAVAFLIMIIGFIPWEDFGVTIFPNSQDG